MMTYLDDVKPIRRLGVTRRHLFEEIDRPALKPLPVDPYEFSRWKICRAGLDYHVEVDGHHYSVPFKFAREEMDVRFTTRTVEIFLKGERVAVHAKSPDDHKHTTNPDHMPSSHRRYAEWTLPRIREEARKIGPVTTAFREMVLESCPHPEMGFRTCLGILRLSKSYGFPRLEAACERALVIGARTYGSVKSILDNNLDRLPVSKRTTDVKPIEHENIRGPGYYH